MRCLSPALLLGLAALPALAHDLWLEREAGGYVLQQGHRHSAHAGAETVPYAPGAVKGAICVDGAGASRALPPGKAYPVKLGGDCAAILASFSTGYWTKTAWETKNQPGTGISGVMKSWLSEEGVKRVDRWTPGAARPLGAALEITPLSDPAKLAVGDKLQVLVTEAGQPRAGVPVAYFGETRGATGEDGRIAIRIRQAGVQLIAASLELPLADGKADTLIRSTALQFEVAK